MIDVKNIVEVKINKIWKEFSKNVTFGIPPLTIEKIPDAEIIFIGINPSLSLEDKNNLSNGSDKSLGFYNLNHEIDDNHKYFRKFHEISEKTELNWSHYDLLFIRETKQNKIKKLLKTKEGVLFLYKQLMVSKLILNELINKGKPKIFVVNNTLTREFLGKDRPYNYTEQQEHWLDYRFIWNEKLGTYTYKKCIFFFSSMLTGQRALDKGSFERLIWHIKYVNQLNRKYS